METAQGTKHVYVSSQIKTKLDDLKIEFADLLRVKVQVAALQILLVYGLLPTG